MQIRTLWLVIAALFLTVGCAHSRSVASSGKDSPVSDLDALASNAKKDLAPRHLTNGKLYCMEDAKTEVQQDRCGGNLEDLALASETDKEVGLANLLKGLERIKLRLNPCGWFGRTFKLDRCVYESTGD